MREGEREADAFSFFFECGVLSCFFSFPLLRFLFSKQDKEIRKKCGSVFCCEERERQRGRSQGAKNKTTASKRFEFEKRRRENKKNEKKQSSLAAKHFRRTLDLSLFFLSPLSTRALHLAPSLAPPPSRARGLSSLCLSRHGLGGEGVKRCFFGGTHSSVRSSFVVVVVGVASARHARSKKKNPCFPRALAPKQARRAPSFCFK